MTTYAIKCQKCKRWSARNTHDLLNYRFKCNSCGSSKKVYCRSKTYIGFTFPKGDIKEVNTVHASKIISNLNEKQKPLATFVTYSIEA